MAINPVTAGNEAQADDLNQYRDHLQGATGSTESYHFRMAGGADFIITLSDAVGGRKVSIRDSAGAEVASIDSDGSLNIEEALSFATYSEEVITDTDSGTTHTIDVSTGTTHLVTLTGNCTFTFSGAVASRASAFTLVLTQDATGSRTATWPASVKWAAGTAPTLTTTAAAVDVLTFFTPDGGTTWYGALAGLAFA